MMTKKDVLFGISLALKSPEILHGNKVLLLTTAGLISADFVFTDDNEYEKTGVLRGLMKGISQAFNGSITDDNLEPHLVGDDDSIMLKNVTIIAAESSKINIPSMILYYKDIIGISIGNLE
ncbi:hypothetical protein [uncultured Veillonella sp.]|uniref:hypothetical protein n=1 Tax=uncultured Veillonella sp. TaxID=159268 RepID=UPI00259A7D2E|nr:hypothetical protein [uncultured Veillonella sp.]